MPITFTGLRPGEKLHERLMTKGEAEVSEFGEQLMIIRPRLGAEFDLFSRLDAMRELCDANDEAALAERLLGLAQEVKDVL